MEVSLDAGRSWLISNIIRFEEPTEYNKHWWVLLQCVMHMPAAWLHHEGRPQCNLWLPQVYHSWSASAQQKAPILAVLRVQLCIANSFHKSQGASRTGRSQSSFCASATDRCDRHTEYIKHRSSNLLGMPLGSKTSSCWPKLTVAAVIVACGWRQYSSCTELRSLCFKLQHPLLQVLGVL